MTTKTKMIVITTDEDLIQQLSTRADTNTNTHIIRVEDQRQASSITKSDQHLLNDLSEITSDIDHIYKRALHSPPDDSSKTAKISRKTIDSICAVCGDRAVGFNYNVLSCNACKIFFHRNANQNLETLKCLTDEYQCPVGHEIRRKCTRCRLVRCFAVGMRKDFLISEEELRVRRRRLEATRNIPTDSEILSETLNEIDQLMMTNAKEDNDHLLVDENTNFKEMEDLLFESLSVEDWLTIENIRSAFVSSFQKHSVDYSSVDLSNPLTSLITWSRCFNEVALRYIEFYRHIEEFEHLHADDRFNLIKYNLFSIYPTSECFNLESNDNYSLYNENEIPEQHVRTLTLWGAPDGMSESIINMLVLLLRLSEQDSIFLILLMIILIFTQGLSMNETEPPLNDPLAVSRAQMRYTTLLWNYLINKRGEIKATQQFIQLMNTILLIQSKTKAFQDLFRAQMSSSDAVDQIGPLLQTVLHIS